MLRLPGQQKCVRNLFWNMTLRVLPYTNQTWLARTQVLHEKLSQKVELTTVRNLQQLDLLQDRYDSWVEN